MRQSELKAMIDRMVEQSIRRVLPRVMNEVLVRTLVESGALTEAAPARQPKRKPMKRRQKPVREQRVARPQSAKRRPVQPSDLNELLDESAGAEFYEDHYGAMQEASRIEEPPPEPDDDDEPPVQSRVAALSPGLRQLAEGMDVDPDDGEMWGSERDSGEVVVPAGGPSIAAAADAVGLDFSRMKGVIGRTAPKAQKASADDARARAAFEAGRIKRMRESLNGGKPVE